MQKQSQIKSFIEQYIQLETFAGILLMVVSALAIIFANIDGLSSIYSYIQHMAVGVIIGDLIIEKTLLHWVNDGLMTLFFFLISLEIKREVQGGELSTINKAMLPIIGAIGGMVVPAIIYVSYNLNDPQNLQGWAIPTATDIAFALGILTLLGKRIPLSLKIFLTTLAVVDDLMAIIILAVFYTTEIDPSMLWLGIFIAIAMLQLNYQKVVSASISLFLGFLLWMCLFKSGIHPTLAGVITALSIPKKCKNSNIPNPMEHLEHRLHGWVTFGIIPVFAFMNAGVPLNVGLNDVSTLSISIAFALFVGKQLGVFLPCFIAIKTGIAKLPSGINMLQLYGVSALCGVGFTMSLFIGSIPFTDDASMNAVRLGVLGGSVVSALLGSFILYIAYKPKKIKK
ncbi:MAG: Na+/H+ antiporter NhaA [Alphaproteobacteria bacterium]